MRPKILHFMLYMWKWVTTLEVQELYQWMLQSRVHIVVVSEIRAKIGLGRRCVESMVEYDQRQSIVSNSFTCLGQSVHSQPLSSLVPQRPSHIAMHENVVMTTMWWQGSNMWPMCTHAKDLTIKLFERERVWERERGATTLQHFPLASEMRSNNGFLEKLSNVSF